jgi:hypothetical protein
LLAALWIWVVRPGFLLFQNTVVVAMKRSVWVKLLLADPRSGALELLCILGCTYLWIHGQSAEFGASGRPSDSSPAF